MFRPLLPIWCRGNFVCVAKLARVGVHQRYYHTAKLLLLVFLNKGLGHGRVPSTRAYALYLHSKMHNHPNKKGNLSLKGQLPQINLRESKHFI
ncbi:hypothetical protein ES332_A09G073800v1 [Gossypium tomentosum]|uniref:Uncharacterized protein n=1 Tax=Gossypium tomentosum TaxID=34277 RepID=A0A5D2P4F8_GOSTO|nr:hypothetical protein ES332_A09G073800v1 [Gossypium tomentosum]